VATRKAFYIDIDGVLADFVQGLLSRGFPFPRDYHFSDYKEEDRKKALKLVNNPDFLFELPPIPEGVHLVHRLNDLGLLGALVTARQPKAKEATLKWLDKVGLKEIEVKFTSKKWEVANEGEISVFVDDNPTLSNEIVKNSPTSRVYLLNYPYNEKYFTLPRVLRINRLTEILVKETIKEEVIM
jgi:uncharacterized HAD superfamily protein